MKLMHSIPLVLAMLFTTSPALAGARDSQPRKVRHKAQRVLDRFDANRDGVLDAQEIERMLEQRIEHRARNVQRFDADRDGRLDPAERQALRAERKSKRFDALLGRFDANRDGALSLAEITPPAGQPARPRLGERLRAADANGDGVVTRAEFARAARRGPR